MTAPTTSRTPIFFGPEVTLPGGDTMKATHSTSLNISQLSKAGNLTHLFPKLKSANLLSIGQFCDDGCVVIFHKDLVVVAKHNQLLLQGKRNNHNGMWEIPLPLQTPLPHKLQKHNT